MAGRSPNFFKRLLIDIAGILLVIASVLTGWIPGPGGLPLFIAGLSLLSMNHDWAKRWLHKAKSGGLNIMDKIFVDHPVVKWTLDIVGAGLLVLSVYLLNTVTRSIWRSLAISMAFMSIGIFLGNRNRLQRFVARFRRK